MIEESFEDNLHEEREPRLLTRRLMMCIMAAIHSSSSVIANVLTNIWSLNNPEYYVEGFREESNLLFEAFGNSWTKARVDQLFHCDSAF
jgi:hypothetical protein